MRLDQTPQTRKTTGLLQLRLIATTTRELSSCTLHNCNGTKFKLTSSQTDDHWMILQPYTTTTPATTLAVSHVTSSTKLSVLFLAACKAARLSLGLGLLPLNPVSSLPASRCCSTKTVTLLTRSVLLLAACDASRLALGFLPLHFHFLLALLLMCQASQAALAVASNVVPVECKPGVSLHITKRAVQHAKHTSATCTNTVR